MGREEKIQIKGNDYHHEEINEFKFLMDFFSNPLLKRVIFEWKNDFKAFRGLKYLLCWQKNLKFNVKK